MNKKYIFVKRLAIYILGLFTVSIGSNLSIFSNMGVSPINSLPYSISVVTGANLGACVQMVYCVYIVLQILILGKNFKWIDLTQIIFVTIFGWFINFSRSLLMFVKPQTYWQQILIMAIALVITAQGVSLYMSARIINLPAEGLAQAISLRIKNVPFHTIKVCVDCSFVLLAVIFSLIFTGEIIGVREGTVITAIFVGKIIPYTNKIAAPILKKVCDMEIIIK